MHKHNTDLTKFIHENASVVLAYAFSQPSLRVMVREHFQGEWRSLHKCIGEVSERRADRALLELATQLRVLDDVNEISGRERAENVRPYGKVFQADGGETDMYYRDMTNKVLHSAGFEWDFTDPDSPKIICLPHDPTRWNRAEIDVVSIAGLIGTLSL